MLQPAPIRQFFMMCEKCQIFVPGRITHGWSTYEDSWTKTLSGSMLTSDFITLQQLWRMRYLPGQAHRSVEANVDRPPILAILPRRLLPRCGVVLGARRR